MDWLYPKTRIDPEGPKKPPYRVTEYPGEFDWAREIDINVWFGEGENRAFQRLSWYEYAGNAGVWPTVSKSLYALSYAETGYEGHDHKSRPFINEEETTFFVDLARDLFNKRVAS